MITLKKQVNEYTHKGIISIDYYKTIGPTHLPTFEYLKNELIFGYVWTARWANRL